MVWQKETAVGSYAQMDIRDAVHERIYHFLREELGWGVIDTKTVLVRYKGKDYVVKIDWCSPDGISNNFRLFAEVFVSTKNRPPTTSPLTKKLKKLFNVAEEDYYKIRYAKKPLEVATY